MSIPEVRVEIEVDTTAGLQPFFTLDDSITGVLDGVFPLGGLAFADISEFVQDVLVERGKVNLLDGFDSGNASVVLRNIDRTFDPEGTSPFKDQLLPRRGINIFSNGEQIFSGIVEDWALDYDKNGDNKARAVATDRFLLLANQELESYTNVVQKSGERIEEVLDKPEVNWPVALRDLDQGQITLQDDLVEDNTNVLNYLQKVTESESGSLFIAKDGKLTFFDKLKGPSSTNLITFSDDGNETPFQEIAVVIGGEFLFNRVIIEAFGGIPQIVEDLTSQGFFGISTFSRTDLLMESDLDAFNKAENILVRFRDPGYRFESLTTDLNSLTDLQIGEVLAAELTDVVEVEFTPNKIGAPIIKYGQIIGIKHDISFNSHRVTFNFDTLDYAPLVLNDLVFGVLDDNRLG